MYVLESTGCMECVSVCAVITNSCSLSLSLEYSKKDW